jgi:hypothetical protein
VFWFSLQLLSETFLILGRNERDMIKKYISFHVKYPPFLSDFNETWYLWESTQISNFMKIRPVGAELFHADGWTDMKKLIVAFRNFANAPKMSNKVLQSPIGVLQNTVLFSHPTKTNVTPHYTRICSPTGNTLPWYDMGNDQVANNNVHNRRNPISVYQF